MSQPPGRHEPAPEVLDAVRRWLAPVQQAMGEDFLAAYVTGGALREGFDSVRGHVNVLVIATAIPRESLDRLAGAIPRGTRLAIEPLFVTRDQLRSSLDVFPIEWLDVLERHLHLAGTDVLGGLEVPRGNLRLQLEQELRGKHLRLRQEYLAAHEHPDRLRKTLAHMSSGFHALFRTLLRLEGETVPVEPERVIERVAALHGLEPKPLLGVHLLRAGAGPRGADDVRELYRRFLGEIERLVAAIDGLRVS
jgi:hypothetical protein